MAAPKKAKRKTSQPSKEKEPRRYAEVRLERVKGKLLTAKANLEGMLGDVDECLELLAPGDEEKGNGAEKG